MMCIDKIKTLFTNKTDAFSILETYETQSATLRQAFLDKLLYRYQALYNREAVVQDSINHLEAERASIDKEKLSIHNMIAGLDK